MSQPVDKLRANLSVQLKAAMTKRDQVATSALRAVMGTLDNASAVPLSSVAETDRSEIPRRELSQSDIDRILDAEIEVRLHALAEFQRLGNAAEVSAIERSIEIIKGLKA
ncbi:hypothetical protein ACLVWU_17485 [Bdellovibrio sp. HCB290]|uniref:hypothetical protein n=1 Tax=Bdellovibrio sp. HCB290 TaxID=3394356 RepID=UPI0039B6249D